MVIELPLGCGMCFHLSLKHHPMKPILSLLSLCSAVTTLAQGTLTPPGAPMPTMKTLEQVEPRTPISALPFWITNSGSYYLTTNLTGLAGTNGLTIHANNVTVDLNGFGLHGVTGSLNGIQAGSPGPFGLTVRNLEVRNGIVRNWAGSAISAQNIGGRFDGLRLDNNGDMGLSAGFFAVVQRCTAVQNGGAGISAGSGSVVSDCAANNNTGDGFITGEGVVSRCAANGNGGRGFFTFNGRNVMVECQAVNNNAGGFRSGGQGEIRGCTAAANFSHGIEAGNSTIVQNCTVSQNQNGNGIQVGSECLIRENNCSVNAFNGVFVAGSENRIEDNNLTRNGAYGLRLDGSSNFVIRNSARGNATGNYLVTGSQTIGPIITTTGTITTNNPWANFEF
jgi:parallel beta-helix repeat protein